MSSHGFQTKISLAWQHERPLAAMYRPQGGGAAAQPHPAEPAEPAEPAAARDDVDPHILADELAEARAMWAFDASDLYFFVRILAWCDAVTCFAREPVKRWCATYAWPKQRGFYFTAYGEEECNHMAREWCRKGHFYCIWLEAGSSWEYRYSQAVFDAYVPDEAWLKWACTVEVEDPVFERILELRRAFPINP